MAMALDTVLLGVPRPHPEIWEESAKRLKSEPHTIFHDDVTQRSPESCEEEEREKQLKPESDYYSDSDSDLEPPGASWEWVTKPIGYLEEKYDNDPIPRLFECSSFVYKNKAQEIHEQAVEDSVKEYLKNARNISPFDAIDIPTLALENQFGRNWPRPLRIRDDEHRNLLIHLSKFALAHYNHHNQGAKKYVFVGFVKATWRLTPLGSNYITFLAKEDTDVDPFNCPAKTFQAHVTYTSNATQEYTKVIDCSIKPDN
ncbi:uncharacterized protein LOC123909808 [Trifolium pratense]|uniref:Uncharacterized protein n=1 Tax=Trifolium pratense TaxID=57577 RepID=A0ACB0LIJ6_TRIPR|nr:uncharacterized protein LOC123909808 [Trifolium pratense]XP_045816677.1 uncharacterized protein LOC123909808 [Trifolium pratense]CAJ2668238.1 unnamed protein product [Trifolium pratense]